MRLWVDREDAEAEAMRQLALPVRSRLEPAAWFDEAVRPGLVPARRPEVIGPLRVDQVRP